jgi:D-alanyl-D-alanine-carboxypeptidase/D-alanyl-D-alanine-endopeptidase
VTGPLGMADTSIAFTESMEQRLAPGHDKSRTQVPNWDIPAMPAAGAIRSTVDDMLKFVAANLGLK